MDREHSQVNSLLAEAANLIRREKKAAGNVEPAEGYKRRQIEELKLVKGEKMKYSQVMKILYSS